MTRLSPQRSMRCLRRLCVNATALCMSTAAAHSDEVLNLSLEDLLDVQVTSVSKRSQALSDAAAAIFVISNDDLRRSGVTSVPEALRMVPGINVARIDANKWAVGARSFNGRFSNKLLVLVDGRTAYSPSFSGVYWEMQDVMLEDVERIEVIRGPGATLWGANAVNGVINIITRHTADTQGTLLSGGGGTLERAFGNVRHGGKLGEGSYGRLYAKAFKREAFRHQDGSDGNDDWEALRGGFRIDSQLHPNDNITLQGDVYSGDVNQDIVLGSLTPPYSSLVEDHAGMSGGHLIGNWQHSVSRTADWTLQAYYDRFDRDEIILHEKRDTLDLDFTHRQSFDNGHDLVWGLGYRYTRDELSTTPAIAFQPETRNDQLFSAFVQDEIEVLDDRLWLTVGSKIEHNDYTGLEIQPSLRASWNLKPQHKLWAAVSRAVRTPSRGEHDINTLTLVLPPYSEINPTPFPTAVVAQGTERMQSEQVIAYEIGYRIAPAKGVSLDISGFYNDYDDLRVFSTQTAEFQGDHLLVPSLFVNGVAGHAYGLELSAEWQTAPWWHLSGAYSYTETDVNWPNSFDLVQNTAAPRHQLSLRSAMELRADLDLDLWLRYTDRIQVYNTGLFMQDIEIEDYFGLDIRLAWRPKEGLEVSLIGQNLLQKRHLEYIQESFTVPTKVDRGVYGKLEWRF